MAVSGLLSNEISYLEHMQMMKKTEHSSKSTARLKTLICIYFVYILAPLYLRPFKIWLSKTSRNILTYSSWYEYVFIYVFPLYIYPLVLEYYASTLNLNCLALQIQQARLHKILWCVSVLVYECIQMSCATKEGLSFDWRFCYCVIIEGITCDKL